MEVAARAEGGQQAKHSSLLVREDGILPRRQGDPGGDALAPIGQRTQQGAVRKVVGTGAGDRLEIPAPLGSDALGFG